MLSQLWTGWGKEGQEPLWLKGQQQHQVILQWKAQPRCYSQQHVSHTGSCLGFGLKLKQRKPMRNPHWLGITGARKGFSFSVCKKTLLKPSLQDILPHSWFMWCHWRIYLLDKHYFKVLTTHYPVIRAHGLTTTSAVSWNHLGWKSPLRLRPAIPPALPSPPCPQVPHPLSPSRDGNSTTALGRLFQFLTILPVIFFFLISNLNLSCHNFRLCPISSWCNYFLGHLTTAWDKLSSSLLTRLAPVSSALTEAELYKVFLNENFYCRDLQSIVHVWEKNLLCGGEELPSLLLVGKVVATR